MQIVSLRQIMVESWIQLRLHLAVPLVLLFSIGIRAQQITADNTGLPMLTRVDQIRKLTPDEAKRGYPVHIRGVVTYYDAEPSTVLSQDANAAPPSAALFVQDSTGGIAVNAPALEPALEAGQIIDLEGVVEQPDFAPQIGSPRWRVIGEAPLPNPRRVSLERMLSTVEDSQWIETEGIVRDARVAGGFLLLDIAVLGGRLQAQIPGFHGTVPEGLVDAEVQIRGACGAIYNQKYQLVGILLYVPNLDQVKILKPAPANPFEAEVVPLSMVQRFAPQRTMGHRIRTQGVVIHQAPGRSIYISNGKIGLRISTSITLLSSC